MPKHYAGKPARKVGGRKNTKKPMKKKIRKS